MNFDQHPQLVFAIWSLCVAYVVALVGRLVIRRRGLWLPGAFTAFGEAWVLFILLKEATTRSDQHNRRILAIAFTLLPGHSTGSCRCAAAALRGKLRSVRPVFRASRYSSRWYLK